GTGFGLHPLLMEDLVNTTQRPKAEDYGDRYYLVLKMIMVHPEKRTIEVEQVSLVLGPHWVLTFQEREADTFDPVRRRLEQAESRVRQHGPDYLMYALVDTVVDNYFQVAEGLGTRVEDLEPDVIASPDSSTLAELYAIKRALVSLRRFVGPAFDAVAHVRRGDSALIQQSTRLYLRDVEDHLVRIMETIDLNREMVQGMVDAYLSALSHRMNDVMRVLTVIATIFIPLTFIVGVYGMNFVHMPELGWRWSYPIVWGIMVSVGVGMLFFFRRRGWF
ncbi:MAG: magnesium/cobalt transporter CorA, partial [Gemmatimonadales bacterium]